MAEQSSAEFRGTLGRYALFGEIAAGGMATVHLARLQGSVGFSRTVAIKRLHPHLAKDPDFVGMFLEEARLAARVRHPNVVATLDVVDEEGELFLVMEYVVGESLSRLVRKTREAGERIAPRLVIGVVCAALEGLHAAHEAKSERGAHLGIVHRDVSPQNIHVGLDGVARVLDFGIAKATNRVQETRTDQIKGKIAYMSPEQLAKGPIDRRADVYSAAVVLWEALTGTRLFEGDDIPSLVYSIMHDELAAPSTIASDLPEGIDAIVMKGLERSADKRWASARAMAVALESVIAPAPAREIGEWVGVAAGDHLAWRMELVHRIESKTSTSTPPPARVDSSMPVGVTSSGIVASPASIETRVDKGVRTDLLATASLPLSVDETPTETEASVFTKVKSPFVLAAIVLLVLGAGVLAARVVQLEGAAVPSASAPVPLPPASASASEHEAAISLAVARTSPSSSASVGARPRAGEGLGSRSSPLPPADCDPPFVVDAKGARHAKPHCGGGGRR